jgi:hypothetical protein
MTIYYKDQNIKEHDDDDDDDDDDSNNKRGKNDYNNY